MGLFDSFSSQMAEKKMRAENAYNDAIHHADHFNDDMERDQTCFEYALDQYQKKYEKGDMLSESGYMRAVQVLSKSEHINYFEYLDNQYDRLCHYKMYAALSVLEKIMAREGFLEKDSTGRYKKTY